MKDQQVITISTRPRAISDKYNQCDTPPPLDKLNAYRYVWSFKRLLAAVIFNIYNNNNFSTWDFMTLVINILQKESPIFQNKDHL